VVRASLLGAAECLPGDVDTWPALLVLVLMLMLMLVLVLLNEAVRACAVWVLFNRRRPDRGRGSASRKVCTLMTVGGANRARLILTAGGVAGNERGRVEHVHVDTLVERR